MPARHLTAKEAAALRQAIVGHRFEAAYALMLGCGLRIGEILGLHWKDVDLANGRAWIGPQYTNGHWRTSPKAKNPHWIPLPSFVVAALIRHRNAQPEGAELVMQSPFQGYGRKRTRHHDQQPGPQPWSQQAVNRDLADLCKTLGINVVTIHGGRHGLASHLMQAGVAPPVIADRLGNTPAVVIGTYGHATDEGRRQADDVVEQYLGGGDSAVSGTETG
jgi:integrase